MNEDRPRSPYLILLIVLVSSVFLLWQGVIAQQGGLKLLGFSFVSGGYASGGDYRMQTVSGQAQGGSSSGGDYMLVSGFGGIIQQSMAFSPTATFTPTPTLTPCPTDTAALPGGGCGTITPTNTPTFTPTFTPTPPVVAPDGDSYEPDDTCATAHPLQLSAPAQVRTFHRAADVDWVKLAVEVDRTYRVDAVIPPGSPADVVMELYPVCNGTVTMKWDETFSPYARIEFQALETGTVYLRLSHVDDKVGGSHLRYNLTAQRLDEQQVGALIIVGGRYRTRDPLQPNIDRITDQVYNLFTAKGHTDDTIYYISTNDKLFGYDKPATVANLQSAITEWAAERVGPDRALTIYMADHGDRGAFYLDWPNRQVMTPEMLSGWLDALESKVPGVPINVIVEACFSGSFIDGAATISKANRLIVSSTTSKVSAYASKNGADFSDHFLVALMQEYSVADSFEIAASAVGAIRQKQQPWLDANGNGKPNEDQDFAIARTRGFQNPSSLMPPWPPYIARVDLSTPVVNRRSVIQAEVRVREFQQVQSVWAVVYAPSYTPPDESTELLPDIQPTVQLQRIDTDLYAAEYVGFDEPGLYRIIVYAQDRDELNARPVVIEIQNGSNLFLPFVTAP